MTDTPAAPGHAALAIVFASALLWGVYWIPVRTVESAGAAGLWAGLYLGLGALVPALVLWAFRRGTPMDRRQALGALGMGTAFALYSASIAYGEVIRVLLFFYLAPAWSTAIECLFFGRRWTWHSALALAVSFTGIVVICRGQIPLDGLNALGDWLALAAGMIWSVSTALVYSRGQPSLPALTAVAMTGMVLVASGCLLLAGSGLANAPGDLTGPLIAGLAALAFGACYILPVMITTLWGAQRVRPATMSFLLTGEIVSGVATAALFLSEPFGAPEVLGAMLIAAGATIEIVSPKT